MAHHSGTRRAVVARLAGQQLDQVQERVRVQLEISRNCIEGKGGQDEPGGSGQVGRTPAAAKERGQLVSSGGRARGHE